MSLVLETLPLRSNVPAWRCLNPEDQLLYLTGFPEIRPGDCPPLAQLAHGVKDWNRFLQKAVGHRLIIRLHRFLKPRDAAAVLPAGVWEKIQAESFRAQAHTLALEGELAALLPLLNRKGIEALLLKGAAFLQTVYRDKPVRFFTDIDFMVRPEDLAGTEEILAALGYQRFSRSCFPSRWHEEEVGSRFRRHGITFVHPAKGTCLEPHVETFDEADPFQLKPGLLWEEAEPVSVRGSRALLPEANRHLAYLLLHLAKHIGADQNYFGWYLDLDAYLRFHEGALDGGRCWEWIRSNPKAENVLEILGFLREQFSTPLPHELARLIAQKAVSPLSPQSVFPSARKSELALFRENHWVDRREWVLSCFKRVHGPWKKGIFILRWIFPDPEYLETKYLAQSLAGRWLAYARHLAATTAKGVGLALYAARKPLGR
ncbi:MAG: nucleotidyltransferase family protein [Candidatus Omnitrophica bacterium]|nr:nucleotidyltransferase family protein [Candidatus Omnitrophota bacterium]